MGAEQSQILSDKGKENSTDTDEGLGVRVRVKGEGEGTSAGLNSVSFRINGVPYAVSLDEPSTLSPSSPKPSSATRLVDFIRDHALLKGTKYMCREGGCGACVVSVSVVTAKDPTTVVKSVNSCLVPLLSCDGWDITTIEALGDKAKGYHPIQKEMVRRGGTQCGYCTPGMVMHMYSFLQNGAGGPKPKLKDIEDSLDGNICRCTGYRPILDAFKAFGEVRHIEEGPLCPLKASTLRRSSMEDFEMVHHEETDDTTNKTKILMTRPWTPVTPSTSGEVWVKATTLQDVFTAITQFKGASTPYRIVAGNTSTGIYKEDPSFTTARGFIDILNVTTLTSHVATASEVILGSCVTLSGVINILRQHSTVEGWSYLGGICQHLKRVANTSVRNVGTVGGNLMLKHGHNEFPSDLATVLEAVGALLKVASDATTSKMYSVQDFLDLDMNGSIVLSIHLKPLGGSTASPGGNYVYRSYKVSHRYQNALPILNAAFLFNIDRASEGFKLLEAPTIVFGGIQPRFMHAAKAEAALGVGKLLEESQTIQDAMTALGEELKPDEGALLAGAEYRKLLAQGLLYKAILSVLQTGTRESGSNAGVKPEYQSGGRNLKRPVTSGVQTYDTDKAAWPLNQPIPKLEAVVQCSGEAEYINDIHPELNELVGAFVLTTVANADIASVDAAEALKDPDVVRFVQAVDIPLGGVNDYMIGSGGTPEQIFASGHVGYAGQPIGLLIAKNEEAARRGVKLVKVTYANVKKPVLTIREALKQQMDLIEEPAPAPAIPTTPKLKQVKGEFEIGSQYHFHMETQICICRPKEGRTGMDVISSTQWMDFVQDAVAGATGLPNHEVYVQVRRLGGGYGGKLSRAAHIAAACAVGAYATARPVRVVTTLEENMEIIGKRAPYLIEYDVSVEEETAKISTLTANIVCDAGLASNEETFAGAKYYMQNCYDAAPSKWKITGRTVNTNTASNTWCRAPGTTQGIAIIEYIMEHVAFALGKDPLEVRKANFATAEGASMKEGQIGIRDLMRGAPQLEKAAEVEMEAPFWPWPAPLEAPLLQRMIDEAKTGAEYDKRVEAVKEFNRNNRWKKRGIALLPMKYFLAYGGAGFPLHISVYKTDGSVAVSFGGIEMGQGINTKVAQTVAKEFGIPVEAVAIKPANSLIGANADSTGGSSTSELCCYAAVQACEVIKKRMKPIRDKVKKGTTWKELVRVCARMGIDLTAEYMYTKNDPPQPYDIWAVNITEVEIDALTGEYKIVRVDLLEDTGVSLNPEIDVGQIEGALVMGLGLWTTEKLIYDPQTGRLLTRGSLEYKPPEARDIPEDLRITLLKNSPNPLGVLRSKATGEPAVCTAVCVLFALRNAIQAARVDGGAAGAADWFQINGPISTEDILRLCLTAPTQFKLE